MSVAALIAHSSSSGAADSDNRADGITIGVKRGTSCSEYEEAFISVSIRLARLELSAVLETIANGFTHT